MANAEVMALRTFTLTATDLPWSVPSVMTSALTVPLRMTSFVKPGPKMMAPSSFLSFKDWFTSARLTSMTVRLSCPLSASTTSLERDRLPRPASSLTTPSVTVELEPVV